MWRFAVGLFSVFLVSCAHGRSCPAIDEERLAQALAAEVLARAEANSDAPEEPAPDDVDDPRYRIDVSGHPVRGPVDAEVTIVEFADFQCPFCARVRPTLDAIRERYGDRVRFVFFHRPLPFHPVAIDAAETANEAYAQGGSDAFYRFYELVFDDYRALDLQLIEGAAVEAGLDVERLRRSLASHVHRPAIDRDSALALSIGAGGTPTFFINGKRLVGALPLESFTDVIDRELANADRLIASGVARGRVYETVMRDAIDHYEEPPPPPDDDFGDAPPPPAHHLDPEQRYRVSLGRSPAIGRADALVTIVMFGDLQDPFSARGMSVLDALVDRYGPNLRVVFKHFPLSFHAYARYSAVTAAEARAQLGDETFFAMIRRFYRSSGRLDDDVIDEIARDLHLDSARLALARGDSRHDAEIGADEALAARIGVTGTPTFFINGRPITGVRPIEQYAEVIDAEVANARRMIASGVPRDMVYVRLAESALGAVDPAVDTTTRSGAVAMPEVVIAEGDASAATTIQVFAEFGTLEAARLEEHLVAIRRRFGARVRIVYRDRPTTWNAAARVAAEVGREVFAQKGVAGYLAYRRAVIARGSALTVTDPPRLAVSAGRAQRAAVQRALEGGTHRGALEEDERYFQESGFDDRALPIVAIGTVSMLELRPLEEYERQLTSQVEAAP